MEDTKRLSIEDLESVAGGLEPDGILVRCPNKTCNYEKLVSWDDYIQNGICPCCGEELQPVYY